MARGADLDNVEGKHLGGKVLGRSQEARNPCGGEEDGYKKVDVGGLAIVPPVSLRQLNRCS